MLNGLVRLCPCLSAARVRTCGAQVSLLKGQSPFERAATQAALAAAKQAAQSACIADIVASQQNQTRAAASSKHEGFLASLLKCCCCGVGSAADLDVGSTLTHSLLSDSAYCSAIANKQHDCLIPHQSGSPRKFPLQFSLRSNRSSVFCSADWHDAKSQFSECSVEYQAGIDEPLGAKKVKELAPSKADWIPETPLAFGAPDMQFVPVPAVTGFAGYWARDESRCGPFLLPLADLLRLTVIGKRVHQSIPGIHIKETDTELIVLAKPGFIPPLIKFDGYTEQYDKSNKTEPNWAPRLDLKIGKGYGKLFLTADGTLVCRVWHRGAFSNKVEVILEHYLQLEEGGNSIKATFNALQVSTGKRVTDVQYGIRSDPPV